jgi:hypothetical protein
MQVAVDAVSMGINTGKISIRYEDGTRRYEDIQNVYKLGLIDKEWNTLLRAIQNPNTWQSVEE